MTRRRLLIVVRSDPRSSPRPAEAVRIGAGLGAWNKVEVNLYLCGPALLCANEFPEELTGGNLLAEYLPAIPLHGGQIYFEQRNPIRDSINPTIALTPFSPSESESLRSQMDCSLEF